MRVTTGAEVQSHQTPVCPEHEHTQTTRPHAWDDHEDRACTAAPVGAGGRHFLIRQVSGGELGARQFWGQAQEKE